MKTFFPKSLLSLCAFLIVVACDKDDPTPAPTLQTGPLESALAGNHWEESIKFIYMERYGDEIILSREIKDEGIMEGRPGRPDEIFLDIIYIEPETGRVLRYDRNTYPGSNEEYNGYYAKQYTIEYDEAEQHVRFMSPDQKLMYMNALAGSEMRLVEQTDEILTFEAPIKPYIYGFWNLDNEYYSGKSFLAIQVRFLKIKYLKQFESVPQLD